MMKEYPLRIIRTIVQLKTNMLRIVRNTKKMIQIITLLAVFLMAGGEPSRRNKKIRQLIKKLMQLFKNQKDFRRLVKKILKFLKKKRIEWNE